MPRVPYQYPEPGVSLEADAIRERRRGELIELDGVLLNAPHIAAAVNEVCGAIRLKSSLPGDIRELLILRVAALNSATYEWTHHESYGLKAGLTAAQLKVIRDTSTALSDKVDPESLLSELQRASLAYADWMTRKVQVPQHVFDALKSSLLNDQQIVEATATVAGYNMVSRYLVALDVGELAQVPVPEALTL